MTASAATPPPRRGWKVAAALCLLALAGGHLLLGGTPVYWSAPIQARVIDETTGKPLEGVAVVALWDMGSVLGDGGGDILHRAEGITGADGRFTIPPMPPKLRWPLRYLRNDDPVLWLYKPGYMVADRSNADRYPVLGPHSHWPRRTSYWDGKTIPLQLDPKPAESFEFMLNEVTIAGLAPADFPNVWRVLAEAYRELPRGATDAEDPAVTMKVWGKREPQ